mmetsp:Transcript_14220/g.41429  ORF Transcript_14220/g.41429 Transcript_14220/m.41429 type:complete len:234 (+) Transcript_14220:2135-2836(+)
MNHTASALPGRGCCFASHGVREGSLCVVAGRGRELRAANEARGHLMAEDGQTHTAYVAYVHRALVAEARRAEVDAQRLRHAQRRARRRVRAQALQQVLQRRLAARRVEVQRASKERRAGRVRHERVDRHVGALRAEDCVHRGDVLRRNVGRTKDDQQARTRRGGPGAATAAEARRRRRHDALNEAERPGQRSREGGAAARRWGCWEKGRKGQSNRALRSWVQCGTARMRRRGS